jgi:hypothetical protein
LQATKRSPFSAALVSDKARPAPRTPSTIVTEYLCGDHKSFPSHIRLGSPDWHTTEERAVADKKPALSSRTYPPEDLKWKRVQYPKIDGRNRSGRRFSYLTGCPSPILLVPEGPLSGLPFSPRRRPRRSGALTSRLHSVPRRRVAFFQDVSKNWHR